MNFNSKDLLYVGLRYGKPTFIFKDTGKSVKVYNKLKSQNQTRPLQKLAQEKINSLREQGFSDDEITWRMRHAW